MRDSSSDDASDEEPDVVAATGERDADESPVPIFTLVISAPDTAANFTAFNKPCEDLDSDFLMQPINEADYDSETQACVDAHTEGGPKSFFSHYTTKRRKKKHAKGSTEKPLAPPPRTLSESLHRAEDSSFLTVGTAAAPAPGALRRDAALRKLATGCMPPVPPPPAHSDPALLAAPGPTAAPGGLKDATARRTACGRVPFSALAPPEVVDAAPPELVVEAPSPVGATEETRARFARRGSAAEPKSA